MQSVVPEAALQVPGRLGWKKNSLSCRAAPSQHRIDAAETCQVRAQSHRQFALLLQDKLSASRTARGQSY